MAINILIDTFQRARSNTDLAVIEGIQALKHAARFNAEFLHMVASNTSGLEELLDELAPDIRKAVLNQVIKVNEEIFAKLSKNPHRTKVMALAKRRKWEQRDIISHKPIVFLEDPKDLENIGAVIRVAAAADAAAVAISGDVDVWHPAVIRGAAGLQWALPVFGQRNDHQYRSSQILKQFQNGRKLISLDPQGEDIGKAATPPSAVLIFGTERRGISKDLLAVSDQIIRLPMKEGVSSLNLATSVAATLYRL